MNEINEQIEQQEVEITEARRAVKLRDAVLRLNNNADFREIFLDGFFKEDAARVVGAMSNPETIGNAEIQTMFQNRITAIGETQQYLRYLLVKGHQMEHALGEYEQTRDELHEEALNA